MISNGDSSIIASEELSYTLEVYQFVHALFLSEAPDHPSALVTDNFSVRSSLKLEDPLATEASFIFERFNKLLSFVLFRQINFFKHYLLPFGPASVILRLLNGFWFKGFRFFRSYCQERWEHVAFRYIYQRKLLSLLLDVSDVACGKRTLSSRWRSRASCLAL